MHERNTRPEQQSGEPTHGELFSGKPSSGEPRSGKELRSTEQSATAQEQPERARQRTSPSPRIYVASLSDYNAGTLHGEWIDADQEPAAIYESIRAMLEASEEDTAEEFAIHDYEGFGSLRISEYESVDWVAQVALGIAEHGEAFGHWAVHIQSEVAHTERSAALTRFEEAYQGVWESEVAYAESLLDEHVLDDAVPSGLRHFVKVDYGAFAAELFMELWAVRDAEGVHVFQT
jgi:antirestriction protein